MGAFWKSFVFVFLSEMGDKTQIVSFAFGAKFGLPVVFLGVFIAIAILMAATVTIGNVAADILPAFWINLFAGILFIAFGFWALRKHEEHAHKSVGEKFGPLIAVMITFFLAELGDKTILASMAMGSQLKTFFPVWSGSTLGMYLADVIAIVSGRILGKHLPDHLIRYGSAAIFFIAGLYTLFDAFMHR